MPCDLSWASLGRLRVSTIIEAQTNMIHPFTGVHTQAPLGGVWDGDIQGWQNGQNVASYVSQLRGSRLIIPSQEHSRFLPFLYTPYKM